MKPSIQFKQLAGLFRGSVPGQLVIQFTDHCNADCPQCGMNRANGFPRSRLDDRDIRRIIDAAAARGIQVLSFTGGEPLMLLKDLAGYMDYAGRAGIRYIRTGTNGFIFTHPEKNNFESKIKRIAEKLAGTPVRNFWISIDSAEPSIHENMRGFTGVVSGIEKALPIFHEFGLYPSANLGVNRNVGGEATRSITPENHPTLEKYFDAFERAFKSAFRRFYRLVIDMGFTMVNCCYPMSINGDGHGGIEAVYAAASEDRVVKFTAWEKAILFKALMETIPAFRSEIRVFSPRTSLLALHRQYKQEAQAPYACRGGRDFFFIDAQSGETWPCGYRGAEAFGKFWAPKQNPDQATTECRLCDWECFRDPSELFGPILHLLSNPLSLIKRAGQDRAYFRMWLGDLNYYRACGFFNGRKPPPLNKMRSFSRPTSKAVPFHSIDASSG